MHGDNQHHRQSGEENARNQFEEERLDPEVEFQQKPAVRIHDRVVAEMICTRIIGGCLLGARLVLEVRRTCVRKLQVILLLDHRHLKVKRRLSDAVRLAVHASACLT